MTSTDVQSLATDMLNKTTTMGDQGATTSNSITESVSAVVTTIEKSFMDNIQYIIIAVVICIILAGVLLVSSPFLFKHFKKTNLYKKMSYNPAQEQINKSNLPAPKGPSQIATAIKNYKKMRTSRFGINREIEISA